jgi:hypothetical protein
MQGYLALRDSHIDWTELKPDEDVQNRTASTSALQFQNPRQPPPERYTMDLQKSKMVEGPFRNYTTTQQETHTGFVGKGPDSQKERALYFRETHFEFGKDRPTTQTTTKETFQKPPLPDLEERMRGDFQRTHLTIGDKQKISEVQTTNKQNYKPPDPSVFIKRETTVSFGIVL